MKTIVLKVGNEGLAWNDTSYLPWAATNLPERSFRFREREAFYWEVRLIEYSAQRAELRVEVADYWELPGSFKADLQPKEPVRRIVFAPFDEAELKAQLSYYQLGELASFFSHPLAPLPLPAAPAAAPRTSEAPSKRAVSFAVKLLELTFINGGVKGTVDLPGVVDLLSFRIGNDHILAEFDTIKPFFVRALKRKTIEVSAFLGFVNDQPELTKASSTQVQQIDEKMLEIFRARSLRNLLAQDRIKTVDKSLFTPEDMFESLEENELGKAVLPREGIALLEEILRHKKVRNARQLTFLAGRLHQQGHPLRFVVSPSFGFVFLASGQDGNHFVLELLDSHATYVWSIPKGWRTLPEQYRAIEKQMQAISILGRNQYRRTLHFEHEFWFVIHEQAGTGVVDGFPRWKNRLLEGLV